jgi:surface antigen
MSKSSLLLKISPLVVVLLLAGCATDNAGYSAGPMLPGPSATPIPAPTDNSGVAAAPQQPSPADKVAMAASSTQDVTPYIDANAVPLMSTVDKTQASNAQYYALQFGRPGAPRNWAGDTGATGSVVVGPFVTVNNLNCRDFTHTVNVKKQSFVRKGTACREADGTWSVINTGGATG